MKLRVVICLMFLSCLLCSCSDDINRKEIDEVDIVRIVGVDYLNNQYTLSVLYTENGGTDSTSATATIIKAEGKTIFEAYENLKLKNKKSITLAHTNYFLIGDAAARNGLKVCLDFISRDETIKMDSLVNVVKDKTAVGLLEEAREKNLMIYEDLDAISQKQIETITKSDNTIANYLNEMEQDDICLLMPCFVLEENALLSQGLAVFKDAKLCDYLDETTSLGINFINNRIRTCPIYLDQFVGLAIADTNTRISSRFQNGRIVVSIEIKYETNVKEVTTSEDIFDHDTLVELTGKQDYYIQSLMQKAIDYSVTTKRDIFGIKKIIQNQLASQWPTIQLRWYEYFDEIQYEFKIHSKIVKSFVVQNER